MQYLLLCDYSHSHMWMRHRRVDTRCAIAPENTFALLACPFGTVISDVTFASFGTPSGECDNFALGACHDNQTMNVIADICLGENKCKLSASTDVFEDACPFSVKSLHVQVSCTGNLNEHCRHLQCRLFLRSSAQTSSLIEHVCGCTFESCSCELLH
jgi:hypothetical protein